MVKKEKQSHVRFELTGHSVEQSNSDTEEVELDDISPNSSQRKFVVGFKREREISTSSGDFLNRDEPEFSSPNQGIASNIPSTSKN